MAADDNKKSKSIIPPSHAPGLDLRTWLAGCAMANSNIVTATTLPEAMEQALAAADTLMVALQNRSPTQESIKSPTAVQLDRWEKNLENIEIEKQLRAKETIPAIRKPRLTPAEEHFAEATNTLRRASETNVSAVRPPPSPVPKSPGFYSVRARPSSSH